ncbi:LOW QUALITY PROTEIN: putative disease resistance RPP13-like protein 1 [Asparagus officinalis]|uniref:LOW QUALITY PROTEIN: putative disease resistance RPP13-like protein 1 n=1 Tax=Asparagus officinalis TaxID=4686 RepID=UPI00098E3613|nr:LOW QUALITY PROTEIN: putative disease resistance RPP13-like protein 1 [Asparagus officinalis]
MVVVGDVIASKIIEKLVDVGFDYAADQFFARRRRMNDELQRLKDALPRIRAVVNAAESGQGEITGDLDEWLWQLKDAVYMASDVLDDLDYTDIQKRAEADAAGSGPRGSKVSGFISDSKRRVSKFSKRAFKSDPTLEKLRGAVKRLSEVAAGVEVFNSLVTERNQQQQQQQQQEQLRETGPIVRERDVLGRDGDTKEVLQWLLRAPIANEDHEGISVFSIVGLGGVGKTTLAQVVYRDDTLQSSFSIKIWVCVSTRFDVKKIMGDILQYATNRRPDVGGLARLQEDLEALVSSKKFLLVLDDVWNDDDLSSWQTLFAPMRCGLKGSKIILTARSKKVSEMATLALGGTANQSKKLIPLDKSNFLSLFNRYAFAGTNPHNHGKLQSIGEQIAGRLGGLPLAAKTIGALLRSNLDDSHWTNILQSSRISDHGPQRDGVMPALMLSYYYLPKHLRPCFAFLSTFPQDHRFLKSDLVLMWMALGFIQQSPQNLAQAPEDIGSRYFDELAKLSFLEQYDSWINPSTQYDSWINPSTQGREEEYIMHDLLHDLSSKVSHGECFTFVGNMSINQIPNTVRHLYFVTGDLGLLKDMDKWKNLHTLILKFNGYNDEHAVAFRQVFESLESIRVAEEYEKVLDCLHPPDSLKELEIERYRGARSPYWMEKGLLKNLERVVLSENAAWKHLPSLGKLPYLSELRLDSLTGLVQIGFEGGFQQLKILDIRLCEQLEEWSGFGAETAPCWPLLEYLGIRWCPKLKALPPLPLSLQSLELWGVGLSDSPTFFPATPSSSSSSPSLTHMEIAGCENLTSVAGLFRHRLSALRRLRIRCCEALADLHAEEGFQHLRSIESLAIGYCPKLKMATDAVALTSLSYLTLSGWNHITSFPSEEACRRLTSLKELTLEDCGGLMSVEGLKALSHLKRLWIEKCPKLVQASAVAAAPIKGKEEEEEEFTLTVGDLSIDDPLLLHVEPLRKLTSVTHLCIADCGNLESEGDINSWLLRNRTSLRSIFLGKYSTAKSLPRSLQALSSLDS